LGQNLRIEKNWCDRDRFFWQDEIENLTHTQNTFIRAAIANTKGYYPDRYQTIAERSDYYAAIDAFSRVGILPRKIRFFGAASQVTNAKNVGCIEKTVGKVLHSEAAIVLLREINHKLFEVNMEIARTLLSVNRIIDPKNPTSTQPIAAIHFDLNMVEFEQSILESYLQTKFDCMSQTEREKALRDCNRDLNFSGAIGAILKLIADSQPMQWAKNALGVEKLDFLTRKHREAIGKAIVLSLHQNTFQDYKIHIRSGIIPTEKLSEYYHHARK
jgi:hypothetical protein